MAAIPQRQTGVAVDAAAASAAPAPGAALPLCVATDLPVPSLPSPQHVLIRVRAVALNPTDCKMVGYLGKQCRMVGCDFAGVVEEARHESGAAPAIAPGTRVAGAVFPYNPADPTNGAFAQWVVSDARLLLRVPDAVDDAHAAAFGSVGWGTAGLAFYDPTALDLKGTPSNPVTNDEPVLVYGGATATGTMAIQMLRLSGYAPIAVTSTQSAPLATSYGAVGSAAYTAPDCVDAIKALADGVPIRHALDCITNAESVAACFAALARTGGRYACLEELQEDWKTRRVVKTREVMGYEGLGVDFDLGDSTYTRQANQALFDVTARWAEEVQKVLDAGKIKTHPIKELPGQWQGVIEGMGTIHRGEVRGQKLVVVVAT